MTTKSKTRLEELLKKFSSVFVIHEFHNEWNLFLDTLSKTERTQAVEAMMNSILENAKAFRQEVVLFAENGTEEDRNEVLGMVNDLKQHPFFTREYLEAS